MNAENNQPPLAEAITQGSTTDKPNETGKAEEGVKNEDTTAIGSNVDEQDKTDNEKDNKPKKIEGASKIKGSFNETKIIINLKQRLKNPKTFLQETYIIMKEKLVNS